MISVKQLNNIASKAFDAYRDGENPLPSIRKDSKVPVSFSCAERRAFYNSESQYEIVVFKIDKHIYGEDHEYIETKTTVYSALFDNTQDVLTPLAESEIKVYYS